MHLDSFEGRFKNRVMPFESPFDHVKPFSFAVIADAKGSLHKIPICELVDLEDTTHDAVIKALESMSIPKDSFVRYA